MSEKSSALGRFLLGLLELLAMTAIYPTVFHMGLTIGPYAGAIGAALVGLVISFLAHKSRWVFLLGFITDAVLIVLPAVPGLYHLWKNEAYIQSFPLMNLLRWSVAAIGISSLLLRIFLSIIIFLIDPLLIERHSQYSRIVPSHSSDKDVEKLNSSERPLLASTAAKEQHPLLHPIDNVGPLVLSQFIMKGSLVLAVVLAFSFIFQIIYSFLSGTIGGLGLTDETNKLILRTASLALTYLLKYGFALLVVGIISLFALLSKPTPSRLYLLVLHLLVFGIISIVGDSYVHGLLTNKEYLVARAHKFSHPQFGAQFDYAMTALTFLLSLCVSVYGFLHFRSQRQNYNPTEFL